MKQLKKISFFTGINFWICLAWGIFCSLVMLWLAAHGMVRYLVNDDTYIALATSGAYGKQYPYTLFTNIVLGYLLCFLYKISPYHNWMTLISLGSIFGGYVTLGVFSWYKKRWKGIGAAFLLLVMTIVPMVNRLNFSYTGVLPFVAGVVGLTIFNCDRKITFFFYILSDTLIIWGSAFRRETTVAVVPFLVLMACYCITKREKGVLRRQEAIKWCVPILAIFMLLLADYGVYRFNSEWNAYREYTASRSNLFDYGIPDYENHAEEYQKIGLNRNDVEVLKRYICADRSLCNTETMNAICQFRDAERKTQIEWKHISDNLQELAHLISVPVTIIFIICVLAKNDNSRERRLLICGLGVFLIEVAYLFYKGRVIERAVLPECISLYILAVSCLNDHSEKRKCTIFYIVLYSIGLIYVMTSSVQELLPHNESNKIRTDALLKNLSDRVGELYVWDIVPQVDVLFYSYSPFDYVEPDALSNSVPMGGWPAQSPIVTEQAQEYDDPYNLVETLYENPNVYFIDYAERDEQILVQYIKDHYNTNVICEEIEQIEWYGVYSFHPMDP